MSQNSTPSAESATARSLSRERRVAALPEPVRASTELPDVEVVRALGVRLDACPELLYPFARQDGRATELAAARATAIVLSRIVVSDGARWCTKPYSVFTSVRAMASRDYEFDGVVHPAPLPQLADASLPSHPRAHRQIGVDGVDVAAFWRLAETRATDACLPLDWLLAFVPAIFWPLVACVAFWGPAEFEARTRAWIVERGRTPKQRGDRRREPGATIMRSTLNTEVSTLWLLPRTLHDLRARIVSAPASALGQIFDEATLQAWHYEPKKPRVGSAAVEGAVDTEGPPAELIGQRLRELERATHAPRARTPSSKAHQRLVAFALVGLYGLRLESVCDLDRDDFIADHVFANGDDRGPALRVHVAKKGDARGVPVIFPLPAELAAWIRRHLRHSGLDAAEPGRFSDGRVPLFISRKLSSPRCGRLAKGALANFFAGNTFGPALIRRELKKPANERMFSLRSVEIAPELVDTVPDAELPRRGSRSVLPRDPADPYRGWSEHAYRHRAWQLACKHGAARKAAVPGLEHVPNEAFARALLGHKEPGLNYGNLKDRARMEERARMVVEGIWEDLWAGGVDRRGPDPERIRAAREQVALLREVLAALRRDADRLDTELDRRLREKERARDDTHRARLGDRCFDLQARCRLVEKQITQQTERLLAAERELAAAEAEQVPVPAELDDAEYERRLAEARGEWPADAEPAAPAAPLADEISTKGAAEVFGRSPKTMTLWRRGLSPPRGGVPWVGGEAAWTEYSKRDVRLRVAAIVEDQLTPAQRARLLDVRMREYRQAA